MMQLCVPQGTHDYIPNDRDGVAMLTDNAWEACAPEGLEFPTEWRITRRATLTIDPANYWPNMEQADCKCAGRAGYELEIDGRTGNVLSSKPGINCDVC